MRHAFNPIVDRRDELARAVVDRQFQRWPDLYARHGEAGREKYVEDLRFHVLYLAEAVGADSPDLFREYAAWVKVLFANLDLPAEELPQSLEMLREVVVARVDGGVAERVNACVDAALAALPDLPSEAPSFIGADEPHGLLTRSYIDALLRGDRRAATALVMERVDAGLPVRDVYLHVFQPAQREIGRLWQTGAITVAHEHFATAATQAVMSMLYPRIFATERLGHALVATCVSGELHEVGIRMVADFFEMAGWDTYYLGANTPARAIIQAVEERDARVLAVSATITAHIGAVTALIADVRQGLKGRKLGVLVGGYPFNLVPDLWRRVGADGFAASADEAVAAATALAESCA